MMHILIIKYLPWEEIVQCIIKRSIPSCIYINHWTAPGMEFLINYVQGCHVSIPVGNKSFQDKVNNLNFVFLLCRQYPIFLRKWWCNIDKELYLLFLLVLNTFNNFIICTYMYVSPYILIYNIDLFLAFFSICLSQSFSPCPSPVLFPLSIPPLFLFLFLFLHLSVSLSLSIEYQYFIFLLSWQSQVKVIAFGLSI